jgi:hypothetical protein
MRISEEEIQRNLSFLNEDELLIVEDVFEGLTQPQINTKRNISVPNIKKIMGQIYGKLGLSRERGNKRTKLIKIYGPGLERLRAVKASAESDETDESQNDETSKIMEPDSEKEIQSENIKKIPDSKSEEDIPPEVLSKTKEPEGEEDIPADQFFEIPKPISVEDGIGEDDTPIDFQTNNKPFDNQNEITDESNQELRDRELLRRFIFGIIVGMGVMALILFQFIPGETPNNANLLDEAQIIEQTVIQEVTVEVPATVLVSAQVGPTQTSRVEQVVVTATQPPPTPTDIPAPVLETGFIFSDDFKYGPDPAWEVVYGEPGMANGKYTVVTPFNETISKHYSVVSDLYWDNLSIDIELSAFRTGNLSSARAYGAIIVHYLPDSGGVGLLIYPGSNGIQFGLIDSNREWTLLDSTFVKGSNFTFDFIYNPYAIRLEVRGDTYLAYINGELITSATIPDYDYGLTGLWMSTNSRLNEPNYYAPRFEYITIESLP